MNLKGKIPGIEFLQFNHAGAMQLTNGETINYGVISFNEREVVYYTGKGLREMWKPNMTSEEIKDAENLKQIEAGIGGEKKLIESGHIAVTPIHQIARVLF